MATLSLEEIRAAHKIVAQMHYPLQPVERGYANRTLYINLNANQIQAKPVTQQMKDTFTGGRGFCLWLLWNAVKDTTRWNDPENELLIAGGPIGGITAYPGTGKTTVVSISPQTHSVMDSNGGGYFGPYLKFSGWDALSIVGKASEEVIIYIDGDTGRITIEAAPLEAIDTLDRLGRKAAPLIPYTKDLLDIGNISTDPAMERNIQGIPSITALVAEKLGMPHDYPDPEKFRRIIEMRALYPEWTRSS